MKIRSVISILLVFFTILFAAACGGGGGGSDDPETPWLCFTANTKDSSVETMIMGTLDDVPILEYSTNGSNWNEFVVGNTKVKLKNKGDKVYIRGNNNFFSKDGANYITFIMFGSISASGNIMSLLDKDCAITAIPTECCFTNLFGGCGELTTPPELPATTLNDYCYQGMFSHCNSLVEAPALPATVLSLGCYDLMFESCDNLSSISVSFTDWNGDSSTLSWVQDVAASGTFKCPVGLDISTVDVDHVPAGWTVQH